MTAVNASGHTITAAAGAREPCPMPGGMSVDEINGSLAAEDGSTLGDRAYHGGARADYSSDEEDMGDQSVRPLLRAKGHRKTDSTTALLPAPGTTRSRTRVEQLGALRSSSPLSLAGTSCGANGKRQTGFQRWIQDNTGFLLIAMAQLFFSLMNTFVALMSLAHPKDEEPVPTWEVIFVRMLVTWLGCIGYMLWAGVEHPVLGPPGVRKLLIIRGIVGFFGLFGIYYSLRYLSLSDATVLTFLSPILSALLAIPILGEAYSYTSMLAGLASMCGVVLIAKPQFLFPEPPSQDSSPSYPGGPLARVTPSERLVAVGVALVGTLGASGAYLTIRYIGNRANALHSIAYFSAFSTLLSSCYALLPSAPPVVIPTSPAFFTMLLLVGVLGFVAQALLTIGLQKTQLGKGMIAVYTHLVFALASERICFGTTPDAYSWLGSGVIVAGAVTVALARPKRGQAAVETAAGEEDLEEGVLGGTDEAVDDRKRQP